MAITEYIDLEATGLVAGQFYKSVVNGAKLTGYNAGSTVLPAGFGAVWTGTGLNVALPTGAGNFAGVLTIPQVEVREGYSLDADGRFGFPAKYEVALSATDMYAVYVDDTVAIGDPVFLRHTAGGSVIGTFRNDADTANAQAIAGAQFMTAAVGTNEALALAVVNFSAK
jgi:hypothetical protein